MESSNGLSQGQENISQPISGTQTQSNTSPVQAPEERTFRQSEVNDIVKKAKYGAVEDYKRLQTEQPQYISQKNGDFGKQDYQPQNVGLPENEVRRLAAEEVQRLREQFAQEEQNKLLSANAQRTVQNFRQKTDLGKEKYSDFDKVTGDINLQAFPNVVQLLGDFIDNSHDVLYELGKDRIKMANLETLAHLSPQDAIIQAQRLSQSIKDNEAASKMKFPNEPLSQMRPSNTGTDNNVMSVKDYRMKYRV